MFVPREVIGWFTTLKNDVDAQTAITREAISSLREELAAVRAERDTLKLQAAVDRTHTDWMRTKLNQLELERAALIERAYNIKLPAVPELIRTPHAMPDPNSFTMNFDDVGDELARQLGLPVYGDGKDQ